MQTPSDLPRRELLAALAVERLVRALDAFGAAPLVARAVAEDAELRRYGWGAEQDRIAEQLRGREAIGAWMARSPSETRFSTVGAPILGGQPARWHARYRMEVAGFIGGGSWRLDLDDDGLVTAWEHRPDDLDPDIQVDSWRGYVEASIEMEREAGLRDEHNEHEHEHDDQGHGHAPHDNHGRGVASGLRGDRDL